MFSITKTNMRFLLQVTGKGTSGSGVAVRKSTRDKKGVLYDSDSDSNQKMSDSD